MTDNTDQLGLFLSYVENTVANHEFNAWKMIDADNKLRVYIDEHQLRSSDNQFSISNDGYSQAALLNQLDEWTLKAEIQLMHMLDRNIHLRVRIVERRQQSIIQSRHEAVHTHTEHRTIPTEIALPQTKIEVDDTPGDSAVDGDDQDIHNSPKQFSEDQVSASHSVEKWQCSMCKRKLSSKLSLENHEQFCLSDRTCEICGKVYTVRVNLLIHSKKEHPGHKVFQRSLKHTEQWPCQLCLKVLTSKWTLEKHEKYCLADRTCDVCSKVFSTKEARLTHIINRHPKHHIILNRGKLVSYQPIQHLSRAKGRIPECIVCKEQFSVRELYLKHVEMHMKQGYQCDQCEVTVKTLKGWRLHRAQHMDERNFVCDICSERFATKTLIYYHMLKHVAKTSHLCSVCGRVFRSSPVLKQHMALHNGDTRPKYSCHLCEAVFRQEVTLKSHLETHDAERKFECFDCGKQLATSHAVKVHMRRHIKNANFKCALCPRMFYSQWSVDAHAWSHSDQKRFSCSLCAKQFKSPHGLRTHERTHDAREAFPCEICNKVFQSMSNLKFHERIHVENRERKFKCDQCPKSYYRRPALDYHLQSHRGDKPFSCAMCGCRFTTAGSLKQHAITHTGEKAFGCTICEKRFTKKHELLVHTRLHTGEKPFACSTCSYRCADKRNLTKHMKSHSLK